MIDQFDSDVFDGRLNAKLNRNMMSYLFYESNNLTKQYKAVIFVNTTSQEAASLPPHFYY